jgi:hypothetical protein
MIFSRLCGGRTVVLNMPVSLSARRRGRAAARRRVPQPRDPAGGGRRPCGGGAQPADGGAAGRKVLAGVLRCRSHGQRAPSCRNHGGRAPSWRNERAARLGQADGDAAAAQARSQLEGNRSSMEKPRKFKKKTGIRQDVVMWHAPGERTLFILSCVQLQPLMKSFRNEILDDYTKLLNQHLSEAPRQSAAGTSIDRTGSDFLRLLCRAVGLGRGRERHGVGAEPALGPGPVRPHRQGQQAAAPTREPRAAAPRAEPAGRRRGGAAAGARADEHVHRGGLGRRDALPQRGAAAAAPRGGGCHSRRQGGGCHSAIPFV